MLHALASGIVGFYIAEAILHKIKNHRGHILEGLLIAFALHLVYNWLILETQSPLYVGLLLLVAAVVVGKAFQNLRALVFQPTLSGLQFKTWQKNPS